MAERKALGKGLSALIPDQSIISIRVTDIPISEIVSNRYQPRQVFKEDRIKELAASIKEKGVIQPILVQRLGIGYEMIVGERRLKACHLLGFSTIPAIVKNIKKEEALELALIENIQREDLNPMEEARAYKLLMEKFNLTQEQVGKKVGRERSSVANMLRMLKLPPAIQRDIEEGKLTSGHARAILACETESAMMMMRKQILDYGLNVRDVEARTKKKVIAKRRDRSYPTDPVLRNVVDSLQRALSTKVTIKPNKKGGGQITIEYYSQEDLERIMEKF